MTNVVRENDEIAISVQELAGTEEHVGELRRSELLPRTRGPVQDQDRIQRGSAGIASQGAERSVMHPQFGNISPSESEIANHESSLARGKSPFTTCNPRSNVTKAPESERQRREGRSGGFIAASLH